MPLVIGYHLYDYLVDIVQDGHFSTISVTCDQYHDIRQVLENKGACFVDFEAGEIKNLNFFIL